MQAEKNRETVFKTNFKMALILKVKNISDIVLGLLKFIFYF